MDCVKFSREYYNRFHNIYDKHLKNLQEELKAIGFDDYLSVSFSIYGIDHRKMSTGIKVVINHPKIPQG